MKANVSDFFYKITGRFQGNKTFWSIAFSYFTLSFLIIAINLPVTYISTATISKKNDELNNYILNENAIELNKTITALEDVSTSTLYNNELSTLLPRGVKISNVDYYNAEKISSIIDTACKSSGQKNLHVAIYLKELSSFITENGVLSESNFLKHTIGISDAESNEFIDSVTNKNQKYFLCGNFLFYPSTWLGNSSVYVFSFMSLSEIMPRIENFNKKTYHNLVMISKDDSVIITRKDFYETFDLSKYSKKQDGDTYISVLMPNKWKYYMIFDNHIVKSSLAKMWILVILNLILELLLTAFLAITFSKKNYTPIKEIKQILNKNDDIDMQNDDFEYIKQGISEIVQENLLTTKNLHSIKTIDNLRNLMSGRCDDSTYLSIKELFNAPSFCIALVSPDADKINSLKANGFSNENIDIIFTNIFEELMSKHYKVCIFNIYDKYCCIINGDKIKNSVLGNILEEIMSSIDSFFEIKTYISVSTITNKITDLHLCYNNATEILSLMQMLETKKIMFGSDFENIKNVKYDNSVAKRILSHINSNQPDKAYIIFEKEINNLINSVHTKMMLEQTVYSAISILDYVLSNLSIDESPIFFEKNNPYHQLLPFVNMSTLMQNVKKYLNTLALMVQDNKNDSDNIELEIKRFIDNNFTNCELSATLISDHFGIKASSLSQMFKKAFNVGMSEYITNLRIQRAKELLDNSEMSLEEISESVGYSNSRSFFRAFKRVEGISPRKNSSKDTTKG